MNRNPRSRGLVGFLFVLAGLAVAAWIGGPWLWRLLLRMHGVQTED